VNHSNPSFLSHSLIENHLTLAEQLLQSGFYLRQGTSQPRSSCLFLPQFPSENRFMIAGQLLQSNPDIA